MPKIALFFWENVWKSQQRWRAKSR